MQRLVRPQWNLALRDMANPGHANRHALAGQPDRPGVATMTAPAERVFAVAFASQRGHFLVEQFLDVHQPQRNQGPDQFHLGIDLQLRVPLSVDDVDRAQRATFRAS